MPIIARTKDQEGLRATNRSKVTLKGIPARKRAMAKTRLKKVGQSAPAILIAAKTRLPVACPVKELARRKPAASPYPPTKASAKDTQVLLRRTADMTIGPA